ncbi:hypothetical protein QOT17_025192 [Balamuthia mandrillaris]
MEQCKQSCKRVWRLWAARASWKHGSSSAFYQSLEVMTYQATRAVRPSKQQLLLAGHLVCYKAIQLWLALSNKKFYACMDLWKTGATLPLHCNRGLV